MDLESVHVEFLADEVAVRFDGRGDAGIACDDRHESKRLADAKVVPLAQTVAKIDDRSRRRHRHL